MSEQSFIRSHQRHIDTRPTTMMDERQYRLMMTGTCKQEQRILWWVTGIEEGVFSIDEYFGGDDLLVREKLNCRKSM
jgi:hypothetical protein